MFVALAFLLGLCFFAFALLIEFLVFAFALLLGPVFVLALL